MEVKLEKKLDVKTLKDFEKDVRTQINNEFETLRKKNDNLRFFKIIFLEY